MKKCNKCQIEKDTSAFHKRGKSGYQPQCKDCKKILSQQRYSDKRDHILKVNAEWRQNNHETMDSLRESFDRKHPRYRAYYRAMRRCKDSLRLPNWVDLAEIKHIYAACPQGLEVDHIIPLTGKTVCGLHVKDNLQYLTASENRKKHNTF